MKYITLIILILSISQHCYSQSNERSIDNNSHFKNALVFTAGGVPYPPQFIPSFQYERTLIQGKKNKRFLFGINTGYSRYIDDEVNIYHLRPYTLIGKYASKFEFSIGVLYQQYANSNTVNESKFDGAINIGYRYQKQGSRFLYRFGVGSPEALYLGVGFRF